MSLTLPAQKIIELLNRELESGCIDSVVAVGLEPLIQAFAAGLMTNDKPEQLKALAASISSTIHGYSAKDHNLRIASVREVLAMMLTSIDADRQATVRLQTRKLILEDECTDLSVLEEYLRERPEDVQVRRKLALLLQKSGRTIEAITQFEEVCKLQPHDAFIHSCLARLYRLVHQEGKALDYAKSCLVLDPHNHHAYSTLGELYWGMREWVLSCRAFQSALSLEPTSVYLMKRTAQAMVKQGNFESAENFIKEKLADNPQNPELHHLLGELFLRSGNQEEAHKALEEAALTAPDNQYALSRRLAHQVKTLPPVKAKIIMARILALPNHAENPFLHALFGEILLKLQDFAAAAQHFRTAYELKPRSSYYASRLATTLNLLGQYEESVRLLEELAPTPHDRTLTLELVTAYERLNFKDKALALIRPVLQCYPHDATLRKLYYRLVKSTVQTPEQGGGS